MKRVKLSPSVICADLVNLEQGVKEIEELGIEMLHVDIIDGVFSPSMPLGLETVRRLREVTHIPFDVHLMAVENEWFIEELINIGVQQITFHYETSRHIERYIELIRDRGIKVGIAINPATSLGVLEYVFPKVDNVLLMLINPGFAGNEKEVQVSYALEKIKDLNELKISKKYEFDIQVDGRVSLETIEDLVRCGATSLVLGSTSLFRKENTLLKNKELILESIKKGLKNNDITKRN